MRQVEDGRYVSSKKEICMQWLAAVGVIFLIISSILGGIFSPSYLGGVLASFLLLPLAVLLITKSRLDYSPTEALALTTITLGTLIIAFAVIPA